MKPQPSLTPIEILLVEDSPTDALLTRQALSGGKLLNRLHVVEDGVKAIAFLRRQAPYADVPRPHLILLDLNLPKMDGREVLAEIKADEDLQTIPIIVLTTSNAEVDIVRSYKLHANCYIAKPIDFASFADAVAGIQDFWFALVTLPPDKDPRS